MKYIKIYEDMGNDVKKGDYVIFIDRFESNCVKKNYPYVVEFVESRRSTMKYDIAWIKCDDGEERSFRAKNSEMYKKISKEEAEILLNANKYNI